MSVAPFLESLFDKVVVTVCWLAAFAAYTYGVLAVYFWIFDLRYGGYGDDGAGVQAAGLVQLIIVLVSAWTIAGIAACVWAARKTQSQPSTNVSAP